MVLLACMAGTARADDVVVGAASGWKLGVTYTDLTIKQGDTLVSRTLEHLLVLHSLPGLVA